jgi:hypothetical protein
MIHLITSIPRSEYSVLPQLDLGQAPGGRWLLYAYLHYAETLKRLFEEDEQRRAQTQVSVTPSVRVNADGNASRLTLALANHLPEEESLSSDVPWGNEGFCVDIALRHPEREEDVTIGVLCDMTRFSPATDPVEWDLFRTGVLEGQGWKFHRVWSPALYSDPDRHRRAIAEASKKTVEMASTPSATNAQ